MNRRCLCPLLLPLVFATTAQYAYGISHDVKGKVFGGEQNFAAFVSAKEVTMERLHAIPVDSEHPYPRDEEDLSCCRHRSPIRLSPEQVKQVRRLLSQASAYHWNATKACLPNYGVLLTFHANPEVKIALCFECDMLAAYVGNKIKNGVNEVADFDSISPRLLAIARAVYPKDSDLVKVKERSR